MHEGYYNNVTWDSQNVTGFDVGVLAVFAILITVQRARAEARRITISKGGPYHMAVLEVKNLKKIYRPRFGGESGAGPLLREFFLWRKGSMWRSWVESGSGKTTLLNIMAALDRPTEGAVYLDGKSLAEIRDKDISEFRRDHLGFVFQEFNLLDTFNVRDNILLPLVLKGMPP